MKDIDSINQDELLTPCGRIVPHLGAAAEYGLDEAHQISDRLAARLNQNINVITKNKLKFLITFNKHY